MSFQFKIDGKSRKAARFIDAVHREIQEAFSQASSEGLTQQELARRLDVNRATVNKRLLGHDNLTLRTIAELAWALGFDPKFKMERRKARDGDNIQPTSALAPIKTASGTMTTHGPAVITSARATAVPMTSAKSGGTSASVIHD